MQQDASNGIMLNERQQEAYDLAIKGHNVFITGLSGGGKSTVIKKIKRDLEIIYQKNIAITSLTGISANLIGGVTLHSYLGILLGNKPYKSLLQLVESRKNIRIRWQIIDTLIIDEVSMLSLELFEKLEKIAREIRSNNKPFGGIQIILTGDFMQLPPVAQDYFIFESSIWPEVIQKTVFLKEVIRQQDKMFVEVLNKVRVAEIDDQVIELLKSREIKYISDTGLIPTMIYSTNAEVDRTNNKYYNRLTSVEHKYTMKFKWFNIKNKDKYLSLIRFKDVLSLKVGAQVTYLVNQNNLFNGSRGVVKEFVNGYPVVLFASGIKLRVEEVTLNIEEQDKNIVSYTQLPLKLAFASSCHSQQGSTLDLIRVDFNKFFADGQVYVALSRVKELKGLYIRNFNENLIKCNKKAKEFYKSIM